MSVTYIGSGSTYMRLGIADPNGSTTASIPTGTAAGDILVALAVGTTVVPSGWLLRESMRSEFDTISRRYQLLWRRSDGADPPITASAPSVVVAAHIMCFRGCQAFGDPFGTVSVSSSTSSFLINVMSGSAAIFGSYALEFGGVTEVTCSISWSAPVGTTVNTLAFSHAPRSASDIFEPVRDVQAYYKLITTSSGGAYDTTVVTGTGESQETLSILMTLVPSGTPLGGFPLAGVGG